jgi:hypothetical protein
MQIASRAFQAVQDFQQYTGGRKIGMARTIRFADDNDNNSDIPPLLPRDPDTDADKDLDDMPPVLADEPRDVQWRDPSNRLVRYLTTGSHISTSDDGADTCVVGDGWKIITRSTPKRYANLVGYDEHSTKKRHLKIVSADSIVTTNDDERVILRVHEAVSNPGSAMTLLSEYQMRENGIIVDSVAKTHKKDADGTFGTQSITIDDHTTIPLIVRGG